MNMIKLYKSNIFGKIITKKNIVPDLAGRFDEFNEIFKHFGGEFISLGDINDRGFQSKQLFDFFMNDPHISIFANHEHLMVDFYRNTGYYDDIRWFSNGGISTLISFCDQSEDSADIGYIQFWVLDFNQYKYHINQLKLDVIISKADKKQYHQDKLKEFESAGIGLFDDMRKFVQSKIDEKYIKYIESTPKFLNIDGLLLTHAPINPTLSFDKVLDIGTSAKASRSQSSLIWNKGNPRRITDTIQIHGHLGLKAPYLHKDKNGIFGLNLDGSNGDKLFVYIGEEDSIYSVDYTLQPFYSNIKIIE